MLTSIDVSAGIS